jgi:hypothetical protein
MSAGNTHRALTEVAYREATMVSTKRSTVSTSAQQAGAPGRSQSSLDWNVPNQTFTPESEYTFMSDEDFSPVWGIQSNSNFGPNGGMVVCQ